MYTVITIDKVLCKERDLSSYGLCYIDDIPKSYSDWDLESKEIIKDSKFSWKDKSVTSRLRTTDYPNPDFIEGVQEFYAYFTPLPVNNQWGDDWDDIPYECNAGCPYDHGDNISEKIEIIQIPFYLRKDYFDPIVKFPSDYGYNSPFSVENINLGAVPWIFIKSKTDHDVINSGITPLDFCNLIKKWYK